MPTVEQIQMGAVQQSIGQTKLDKANENALQQQTNTLQNMSDQAQQQFELQQETAAPFVEGAQQAQQAQLALLGQSGPEAAQQAAQNLLNSPLVQAVNQQNQQNIQAQAAASGISGGNLLTALQDANTSTILQAGLGGLGQISGQQLDAGLGFSGLAQDAFGQGLQQQGNILQGQVSQTLYQGQQSAAPNFGYSQGVQQQQQQLGNLLGLGASIYAGGKQAQQPAAATGSTNKSLL